MNQAAPGPLTIQLDQRLEGPLSSGHAWVYRERIPHQFRAKQGSWVLARAGKFRSFALWDENGPIALRIFHTKDVPTAKFFEQRLHSAWQLRLDLLPAETDAYRLCFGEADSLPGLVIDRYGPCFIISLDTTLLEPMLNWIKDALLSGAQRFDGLQDINVIYRARESKKLTALHGTVPARRFVVHESGLKMWVDLENGQKTGLFLDHRENRRMIETLSGGRSVLNLFGYTGGFSLYAARGGATSVTTVDVAGAALLTAAEQFRFNGLGDTPHETADADCFEWLAQGEERYDLVVSDPPSFARSKEHVSAAVSAYTKLHRLCMSRVTDGGYFAAGSCTSQIGPDQFKHTLAAAAARARVRAQIVHEVGHAPDHPVNIGHHESRYLKFVVMRITRNY